VFIVVYFVIVSVRTLLDTLSFSVGLHFMIHFQNKEILLFKRLSPYETLESYSHWRWGFSHVTSSRDRHFVIVCYETLESTRMERSLVA